MDEFSFDTYADYGLSENPFVVDALRPDAKGRRLLVGRDEDLKQVARCLHKHAKIEAQLFHDGRPTILNCRRHQCV